MPTTDEQRAREDESTAAAILALTELPQPGDEQECAGCGVIGPLHDGSGYCAECIYEGV